MEGYSEILDMTVKGRLGHCIRWFSIISILFIVQLIAYCFIVDSSQKLFGWFDKVVPSIMSLMRCVELAQLFFHSV